MAGFSWRQCRFHAYSCHRRSVPRSSSIGALTRGPRSSSEASTGVWAHRWYRFPSRDAWDNTDFDLLEIVVGAARANAVLTIPAALATVEEIPDTEAVNLLSSRPFELAANPFGINGKRMDMNVIDQRIRLGDTEVWEITNPTSQAHPFHVHGDSFQVLSRDGFTPPEHELGWKDVVLVRPNETVRIIKRFRDYGDAVNPFMFHCHILEHEDVGMMGQFVVEVTP